MGLRNLKHVNRSIALIVLLVVAALATPLRAAVVDFESTNDFSLFNFNSRTSTGSWSSSIYNLVAGAGIGGSSAVTPTQPNNSNPISAIYNAPIEISDSGIRELQFDFGFQAVSLGDRVRIGFVGTPTESVPGRGSGTTILQISNLTSSGTGPQFTADATFAGIDQTDTITNYYQDHQLQLTSNHWYMGTLFEAVVGDTATIWGGIDDIGAAGTSAPVSLLAVNQNSGLSFPASILNNGFSYGGFAASGNSSPAFPLIDHFVTPEPSTTVMLLLAVLWSQGLKQRAVRSRRQAEKTG